MKINLEKAMEIARIQKELGICSCNGQALVLLYDEVERLKEVLSKLSINTEFHKE